MRIAACFFLSLTLAGMIFATTVVENAHAGTYEVVSCKEAPNGESSAWQSFTAGPASSLTTTKDCPPVFLGNVDQAREVGLAAYGLLTGLTRAQNGSTVGWRFTAPLSTTIVRLRYARYIGKFSDPDWRLFTRLTDGTIIDTCHFDVLKGEDSCAVGIPGSTGLSYDRSGLSTSSLETGFTCIPQPPATVCSHGASRHFVWAAIYGSRVTINDPVAPRLGSVSGSLVDGGSSWRSGADEVNIAASDNVGIRETQVRVNGGVLSAQPRVCDFTRTVPCTNEPGVTHAINWKDTGVKDGKYTVEVVAVDAAGNEVKSAPATVNVDTQPPKSPLNLSTPTPSQDGQTFPLMWLNPSQSGTPITRADWKACLENNPLYCVDGFSNAPDIQNLAVTIPARGRWQIKLWLTDELGHTNPGTAATLVVENQEQKKGGPGGGEGPLKPIQPRILTPSVKRSRKTSLKLSGTITPITVEGNVMITLSYRSKPAFKRLRVPIQRGTWKTTIKTPTYLKRRLRGLTVTISYPGGKIGEQAYLPAKISRKF